MSSVPPVTSTRFVASFIAVPWIALVPSLAFAHPEGHAADDALAGFLHPFTGIDHLLAMFAVGLWAARLGRTATWTLPIVFPVAMMAGAVLALRGVALPVIEPMIAASVIVLGLFVAAGVRLPTFASSLLVAAFAVFHGYAHAVEAHSAHIGPYAAGFVSATVILHALGILCGMLIARRELHAQAISRIGGSLIALTGTALLLV